VRSREPITCFTGGVARASRARARRDPPADATTDLARDDRDTAPRPRAAPVPTAAGRVEHWPAIPPGARSEIDNRPPPRNAKRRSGLTVTLGRCCPRRLAARFADVVGFHRPRLNSPRLHTAARTRLPVGSTPRPTRSVMPRRAATCTAASFFFGAEAHEALEIDLSGIGAHRRWRRAKPVRQPSGLAPPPAPCPPSSRFKR
jgi:hypothetical protein